MAGICGSHYILLAELGQNTEETGGGSAGDSVEDHTGTESPNCAWALEPSVMGTGDAMPSHFYDGGITLAVPQRWTGGGGRGRGNQGVQARDDGSASLLACWEVDSVLVKSPGLESHCSDLHLSSNT